MRKRNATGICPGRWAEPCAASDICGGIKGGRRLSRGSARHTPAGCSPRRPTESYSVIHAWHRVTLQSHITESDTRVSYHRVLQLHRGRPLCVPQAEVKWCRKPQRRAVPPCLLPPGTQTSPLRLFAVLNPHLHLTGFDQGYGCQDYLQSNTKLTQGPMHPE